MHQREPEQGEQTRVDAELDIPPEAVIEGLQYVVRYLSTTTRAKALTTTLRKFMPEEVGCLPCPQHSHGRILFT